MKNTFTLLTFFAFLLFANSCSFKLKGSENSLSETDDLKLPKIEIIAISNSNIAPQLKKLFGMQSQQKNQANSIYKINLTNEKLENKVISYDGSSEPNGYEIKLTLSYEIVKVVDKVREVLFEENIENLDYLFITDGDSLSEVNQEKMKEMVSNLANQIASKIYSNAIVQLKNDLNHQ